LYEAKINQLFTFILDKPKAKKAAQRFSVQALPKTHFSSARNPISKKSCEVARQPEKMRRLKNG
jgi:hypothetical protein